MTQSIVRELWGNKQCSWVSLDAEGSSGGILLCWNSRLYTLRDNFKVFSLFRQCFKSRILAPLGSSLWSMAPQITNSAVVSSVSLTPFVADGMILGVKAANRISPDSQQKNLGVAALQQTWKPS